MTRLPPPTTRKLGLVIDLDTCVGCHACAIACKEWNEGGAFGPLPDEEAYGAEPMGVWFNRVHSYEVAGFGKSECKSNRKPDDSESPQTASANPDSRIPNPANAMSVHFPRSCLHCETPACVTVCPTGASYKRAEDGIVLVDEDKCIGCQLCAWACPYGAREFSAKRGVMQKCTLCVDRIYNETLDEADRQPACVLACPTRARHFGDLGDAESNVSKLVEERGGYALMPELGYKPVNRYLPPRPRRDAASAKPEPAPEAVDSKQLPPLLRWVDRVLSR
ncbi:4Fe-4S dicluster domain-containing protein [Dokdonella sp.]|uniref:4Fe-4S dicluster domain-containing protein n=1 Tax=Dokdonella sp. TaxID=2291710 RepID=UPI0035285C65